MSITCECGWMNDNVWGSLIDAGRNCDDEWSQPMGYQSIWHGIGQGILTWKTSYKPTADENYPQDGWN